MNDQTSWTLRQQMLEDRIKNIAQALGIDRDKAFMRLFYALLFNTQYDDPDYDTDVVDGGGDKQIDIVRIEEALDDAVIHLIQVKNSEQYKGTTVVQLRDGLEWVFKWPEEKYNKLVNKDLVVKVNAIRELSGKLGLRNLDVVVHYVAKGNTERLSPDFVQEVEHTKDMYASSGEFRSFDFRVWGVNELIELSYELESETRRIDVNLPIYLTPYETSFSKYRSGSIQAAICTVDGVELAQLVNQHQNQIFEENVRTYLGHKKKINSEILHTCSDDNEAEYFWFFNNGITITCDDFDVAYNANPPCIKIFNMQIVNGCQTSMTLAEALKRGVLSQKTRILLKVYATQDIGFVDKITLTTNSQNAVSNRDLRSNDTIQRDLEKLFKNRGYHYERKPRTFDKLTKAEKKKIISNEKLGQAHLAIVQRLPATAMAQKAKIWTTDYYYHIFTSKIDELLAIHLIYNYSIQRLKLSRSKDDSSDSLEQTILKYGTFHLARIIGSYQLGEHWRSLDPQKLAEFVQTVEKQPSVLDEDYEKARKLLRSCVEKLIKNDASRIMNIFKSGEIQKELDSALIIP